MSSSQLLAFAAMSLLVVAIPGPAILFVVGRALAHGRRVALNSVAGVSLGTFGVSCLVVVGLGAIVQASATAFTVVKRLGNRGVRGTPVVGAITPTRECPGTRGGNSHDRAGRVHGVRQPRQVLTAMNAKS